MINYFRKIRQRLLSENRLTNYLLYAIGEIVLVVVGIIIALQINNWNETRKQKEKEKIFLKEIISDLEVNVNLAQDDIDSSMGIGRDSLEKMFGYLINHLENKLPYEESLSLYFYKLHQLPGIEIKLSGFESLKSSGMDIIQNDSIRSKIGEYFTVTVNVTKEMYKELRDDFYNYVLQFPRTIFITKKNEQKRNVQIPINYMMLLENIEYVESMKMFSGIYGLNLYLTKEYIKETKKLKKEIEKYLASSNLSIEIIKE